MNSVAYERGDQSASKSSKNVHFCISIIVAIPIHPLRQKNFTVIFFTDPFPVEFCWYDIACEAVNSVEANTHACLTLLGRFLFFVISVNDL